jgi:hypothetical protein
LHWLNDRNQLSGILNIAARVLCDSDPDAAATIQGAVRALVSAIVTRTRPSTEIPARGPQAAPATGRGGLFVELRRETMQHLTDHLGDERLRELRDRGSTMDPDHAVAYTLVHLDQYLAHADD